jgi:proteasome assembly chaperone 3
MADQESYEVTPAPFPAHTKIASGAVNEIETTVASIYFTDKILITITQSGRLAHWVHVSLDALSPTDSANLPSTTISYDEDSPRSDLLPLSQLTATTVLGGMIPELDTLGQLCATQIASAIATKDPRERRMLVLGLGLEKDIAKRTSGGSEGAREEFAEIVNLVLGVL